MGNGEDPGDGLGTAGTATRQETRGNRENATGVIDFAPVVIATQFWLALACQMAKSAERVGGLKLRRVVSGQSRCYSTVKRYSDHPGDHLRS